MPVIAKEFRPPVPSTKAYAWPAHVYLFVISSTERTRGRIFDNALVVALSIVQFPVEDVRIELAPLMKVLFVQKCIHTPMTQVDVEMTGHRRTRADHRLIGERRQ